MKKILLFPLLLVTTLLSYAQIGFGTSNPDPSAAVEIKDSTRGLLIPRMDMTHRNNIQNPATGLMIYQTDSIKGFWYYDGTEWRNINASGGKRKIIISDTISNSAAQAKIATEFGVNTEEIAIDNCTNLTSIDLSMFTSLINISIVNNAQLMSVNLSNLKICNGCLNIANCPSLTNLNVLSLEKIVGGLSCTGLSISNTGFTTLAFPKLNWVSNFILFSQNAVLTTISLPVVLSMPAVQMESNPALTTISCPLLQRLGSFYFIYNNALTTLSFPSLVEFYMTDQTSGMYSSPNFASLSIGNLTSFKNARLEIYEAKLTSANVNSLLQSLAGIVPPITNKSITISNMTPPAPPTGQGLTDKATLIANGNNIATD